MKKLFLVLTVLFGALVLVACKDKEEEIKDVKLDVWASELDQDFTRTLVNEFIELNKDKVNLTVNIAAVSEADTKDEVLKDIEAAADVFAFADDQVNDLMAAGALQEILEDTAAVIAANGGKEAASVQASMRNDKLYAYPMTADNGYFLFYDKSVHTADNVLKLDTILETAKTNNKKFGMEISGGWYLYSFFKAAGLDIGYDGSKNNANWDKAPEGVNVLKSLIAMGNHDGYMNASSDAFVAGIKAKNISAGVSGVWNAAAAEEAWGDNYAATKLPTYTLDGKQVQMSSFAGFKLFGVNKTSANTGWAMRLANFLTNEQSQLKRFNARQLGPSNVKVAASPDVMANPAIAALALQAQFATIQNVGGSYWGPSEALGTSVVEKTINAQTSVADLQAALELAVQGMNQAPTA